MQTIISENKISIFWPDIPAPDIMEVQFSYKTCRTVSRENCPVSSKLSWTDCKPDKTLGEALSESDARYFILVNDPELVLSAACPDRMAKSLDHYSAACPVYNETGFPAQIAALPFLYYNLTTFLELADILSVNLNCWETDSPDPGCILYRREFLENISGETFLKEVHESLRGMKTAVSNVLVHRFGNYYHSEREDLIRMIPDSVRHVLDVGCAMGGYGKKLKQLRPEIHLSGVELNPLMAEKAAQYYDEIKVLPVEKADFHKEFDLINCGDIIEHLYEPWEMLQNFHRMLKPGGYLVISIPNAGHWSIVSDLLQGKFQYIPVGLLCVTHIRWFTESSITKALEEGGFRIETFIREQQVPTPRGQIFTDQICEKGYGNKQSLLTHEFLIRAEKINGT